jgi:pimeloyl-ACP methyl ester carboxylesterase
MEIRVGQVMVHYAEHGTGRPVLVLHGAGVDHREAEACFELVLDGVAGLRRIYPDPPGMGRTTAPETLRSADDVLDTLLNFADELTGGTAHLLIGHSAGAYYAQAMAARRPAQVAGLALVCPLLPGLRDVPEHRVVAGTGEIGDDVFRSYFVIQTPQMLQRYQRYVAPAAALVDQAALERIGERWALIPITRPRTRVRQWSWRGGWTRPSGMPPPPTSASHPAAASLKPRVTLLFPPAVLLATLVFATVLAAVRSWARIWGGRIPGVQRR